ncbi:UNKNOWN [Stylonychia lemnae]|uniref:Uncharacterized protein n=1 Tax=Stylonychia lemnae TaxID=5949 RepID=A0A078ADU6_STYLE|nr:UNKNOWN [Stylonychia lemnae]|eukprot:CDW79712.1 UNKNOWN [Stylonychia lemnae]
MKGEKAKEKKYIVMSRHGYDLQLIHKMCGNRFTYKTALSIGIEMVDKLNMLCQSGYLQEDLKLSNILIPLMSDLPWKYKTQNDIFNKQNRQKVKDSQIIMYLKTLDDKFQSIYKWLRIQNGHVQNKNNNPESFQKDIKYFKSQLQEILSKHQSDNEYKFDWYPILAKIQRFNRKQGMNPTITSYRGSITSAVNGQERKVQRKGTFQMNSQNDNNSINGAGMNQELESPQKSRFRKILSPVKARSKSANVVDDDHLYLVKEQRECQIFNEMEIIEDSPLNVENNQKNESQYNFLKLLEGSQDVSFEKRRESQKYFFGNKVSQLAQQQTDDSMNNMFNGTCGKMTMTMSSKKMLFERTKKSTMLLVSTNEQDSQKSKDQNINNLEDIVENSISLESEDMKQFNFEPISKVDQQLALKNGKPYENQGMKSFVNQFSLANPITSGDKNSEESKYALEQMMSLLDQCHPSEQTPQYQLNQYDNNKIFNTPMAPTFNNISIKNQTIGQNHHMYSNNGSSINDIHQLAHGSSQNYCSINNNGPVMAQDELKARKYSENYNRKYSGMEFHRKNSMQASEISIITIDRFGCNEYDEGVNINSVRFSQNNKVNPLNGGNHKNPRKVMSRTLMSCNQFSDSIIYNKMF